jgi:hypothetical protein
MPTSNQFILFLSFMEPRFTIPFFVQVFLRIFFILLFRDRFLFGFLSS